MENKKVTKNKLYFGIVIFILLICVSVISHQENNKIKENKMDKFVLCLKEKGAIFYGSDFFCEHCDRQKKIFGASANLLPFVECSTPLGDEIEECINKKITGYPIWEFTDGTRLANGEISIKELAQKTSCPMPE